MDGPVSYSQTIDTPAGSVTVEASDSAVTRISFRSESNSRPNHLTRTACDQLMEYFEGKRQEFTFPLQTAGTAFQELVWKELRSIPFGETVTYGFLANRIGSPNAARAVGGAVGANPIAIVIPCHRVMASNGAITGYTGGEGVKTKRLLLDLENIG